MGLSVTQPTRDISRRYQMVDDFIKPTLDGWDLSESTNGTAALLNADVPNASDGIGNVELTSGPAGGDDVRLMWGTGPTDLGFVTGGSRPLFSSRFRVIGPLADIAMTIGLHNVSISMVAYLSCVGAGNWFLNLLSPVGGGGPIAADIGLASALGRHGLSIEVVPAQQVIVTLFNDNGQVRFVYDADPTAIGRSIERCRPGVTVAQNGGAGGIVVVDYIEVQGNRP